MPAGRAAVNGGPARPSPPLPRSGYFAAVSPSFRYRPLLALGCAALASLACSGAARPGQGMRPDMSAVGEAPQVTGARPLAGLLGQRVLLLPAQRLVPAPEAAALARDGTALLRRLDEELAFALQERALGALWSDAGEVAGMARRNPTYAPDPLTLPVPGAAQWRAGDPVREPLGSQLRALAALADARWAVLPLELQLTVADGMARAVVGLALVDVRTAQVLWVGATPGTAVPVSELQTGEPAAIAGTLAARAAAQFTDLIVAPREP